MCIMPLGDLHRYESRQMHFKTFFPLAGINKGVLDIVGQEGLISGLHFWIKFTTDLFQFTLVLMVMLSG